MDELERFRKKALSYRQALAEQPSARLLELYPILWYLEKHRQAIGKRKKRLRIVDLMSGSGFLSENLYELGYTDLHAVEFCAEMYKDASAYNNKARLHHLSSFDHLEGVLDEIKPDVIVSLASFHHLLIYGQNDEIDKVASTNKQSAVVDICMRALPDQGILLIADLIEADVTETPIEPFKSAMEPITRDLNKLGIDKKIVSLLSQSNSLHGASSLLHREWGTVSGNASLKWFRDVVDVETFIGHKDIAISADFLQRVASYRPIVTKYACPWVFKDKSTLEEFVYKKFAFGVVDNGVQPPPKEKVMELVDKSLGIRNNHGVSALGWNLGVVLLGKLEPFSKELELNTYVTSLLVMVAILTVAISLRYLAGVYVEIEVKDLFIFLLTLPVGIMLGGWITKRKDK